MGVKGNTPTPEEFQESLQREMDRWIHRARFAEADIAQLRGTPVPDAATATFTDSLNKAEARRKELEGQVPDTVHSALVKNIGLRRRQAAEAQKYAFQSEADLTAGSSEAHQARDRALAAGMPDLPERELPALAPGLSYVFSQREALEVARKNSELSTRNVDQLLSILAEQNRKMYSQQGQIDQLYSRQANLRTR